VNAGDQQWYGCLQFTRDGHLLAANGENQLLRWDLATGEHAVLLEDVADFVPADDGRSILVVSEQRLSVHDLEQDRDRDLPRLCAEITAIDLDPTGAIAVAGCQDGIIQVGRVTGEEPHLLLGHKGAVRSVAVSPDGRWIVSGGLDGTVRMWPMPDLDKTPLHSLPHDDLVAKLEAFTNLRAVADDSSPDGWVLEAGPFPGWANLPEW
jgi:WD40 repeat protein